MALKAALQERFYRWALRGKPPEPTPIVLTQRRVYVLPTGQGVAFAGMLVLMLVAAMNYNLSLGYALVFLLAGLGTVTILHTFRNLAHLQILSGRTVPVFAGETAGFCLNLVNLRDAARPGIRLNLPARPVVEVEVPAQGDVEVRLDLPAPKRGWLAMPRVTLATTYPLGLIRTWSYAAPDLRCLAYPAPAPEAPPLPEMPGLQAATHSSPRAATILPGCVATSRPTRRAMSPGKPWRVRIPGHYRPSCSAALPRKVSGSTGPRCRKRSTRNNVSPC